MKVLVLGAGAVGGYYGARLIEGGADVTFLVRPQRAALLAARGLVVRSEAAPFERPVSTVESVSTDQRFDAVLLTCKTYDLGAAMDAIAPAVQRGAVVVPLLNGIGAYDALDARFGRASVLGGVAYIATMLEKHGDIVQFGNVDHFIVGARDPGQTALAESVHAAMAGPGPRTLSTRIEQDLWDKWVTVGTAAAVTCLMRGNVDEILASDDGRRVMVDAMAESRAVAAASGFALSAATVATMEGRLLDPQLAWAASMRRDIAQGAKRLEVDIVGDLLRRADAAGIDAPMFRAAHAHLLVYELQMKRAA